jgi:hypothetical protein
MYFRPADCLQQVNCSGRYPSGKPVERRIDVVNGVFA